MSGSEARRTDTIPEWKRVEVGELAGMLEQYESVGIVDVTGIPSRQLQQMRRDLHGTAELRVGRNTLMRRALEEVGDDLEELTRYVSGQVAFVGTDDNPFGLYQRLEASKTPAPINAGEVAPNDIVIPEGDTGIDPGPFVGELQQVGASARIGDGSIQVTEDSTVLEAGGEVSAQLANVLGELGIEPKEVGLDLRAVHSEGIRFEPDELALDIGEYRADVESAAATGRALAVGAAYPTAGTTPPLLALAASRAKAVGLSAAVEDPAVLPDLVRRSDAQARALAAAVDDDEALPEELRGVETPEPAATEADESGDDGSEAETDAQADDQTDAEADDADDDDDGAEGLGEMFG